MRFPFHEVRIVGAPNDDYYTKYNNEGFFYDDVAEAIAKYILSPKYKNITLVDAGANIGLLAIYAASIGRHHCKTLDIHSFEPAPEAYRYLSENIINSPIADMISTYNVGLGATEAELLLAQLPGQAGSYIQSGRDGYHPHFNGLVHKVPVCRLDAYTPKFCKDDSDLVMVKIDVEGYELDVLNGASDLVSYTKSIFFIEFNPWLIKTVNKEDPAAFLGELLRLFKDVRICDLRRTPGINDIRINETNIGTIMRSLPNEFAMMDVVCTNNPQLYIL